MAEARVKRRLAAILAADVVGYSRLISSVSALLVELAERHRNELEKEAGPYLG